MKSFYSQGSFTDIILFVHEGICNTSILKW